MIKDLGLKRNNSFCGPPGANLGEILGIRKAKDDVASWFEKRKAYYFHKGRITIRYICELMDIKKGDEILVPAYNCGSEIDPLIKGGASVVPYRVDRSACIDMDDLCRRITGKTKAVYITHYFGFPQAAREIKRICQLRGLYLIEDCALSLFSRDGSEKLGTFGDVSLFSLTKSLPVPDGGILIINNPELKKGDWRREKAHDIEVLRRSLGLSKSNILRGLSKHVYTYHLYQLLFKILSARRKASYIAESQTPETRPDILPDMYYNEKLNNKSISGIAGRMLGTFSAEFIIKKRRENFLHLGALLEHLREVKPLFTSLPEGVCPLHFPVIVKNRDEIKAQLFARAVDAASFWRGYHRELPWDDFPDACYLKAHILALPIHHKLGENDMTYIAKNLIDLCQKNH